jgi:hypothetical protein
MKSVLKGTKHGQQIFTPVSKLTKSLLDEGAKKMLAMKAMKAKSMKGVKAVNAPVKETKRFFVVAGGDQCAESTIGAVKQTMRRFGSIGRLNKQMTKKVPNRRTVDALAAAAVLRKAGFQTVLDALRDYRIAGAKGELKVSSTDAYNMNKCWWAVREPENTL